MSAKIKSELENKLYSILAEIPELKDHLKENPHSFIKDKLGVELPEEIIIKLVELNKNELVLTLPNKAQACDKLNDDQLKHISGGTASTSMYLGCTPPATPG